MEDGIECIEARTKDAARGSKRKASFLAIRADIRMVSRPLLKSKVGSET